MDKQLKKEWLKALRSGKYRQTDGKLCETNNKRNSYCCLGVLARVAGASFKTIDGEEYKVPFLDGIEIKSKNMQYLTDGFGDVAMRYQQDLATMNDDGHNFLEIADWIEQNL